MRGIPFFVRAAFESGTMSVPAGADVDGGEKRLQSFGVKYLTHSGKK